jgi:hypothetical protein
MFSRLFYLSAAAASLVTTMTQAAPHNGPPSLDRRQNPEFGMVACLAGLATNTFCNADAVYYACPPNTGHVSQRLEAIYTENTDYTRIV